jgi:hypothetical protein
MEKLDGTNTRIIVLDEGSYLIGCREALASRARRHRLHPARRGRARDRRG